MGLKVSELNPNINTIKIVCEAADTLPLEKLTDFQGNLKRLSDKNRDKLVLSICEEGFMAPVFIWRNEDICRLLDGHGRLKTLTWMKNKGWKIPEIPVVYIEAVDVIEARRKLLKITSQYGEFDTEELNIWLEELDDDIGESIRLVDQEMELNIEIEDETDGDDDVPEVPEDPETVLGDLWELGDHRLLCGDSTVLTDVEKLTNNKQMDLLFTDPPYNVSFNGRSGKHDVIMNDNLSDNDFKSFIDEVISIIKILNVKAYYVWCNWNFYGILQGKLDYKSCIVWAKNVFGMGNGYRHQHEFCLYNGAIDDHIKNESDLWEIKKDSKYVHPTQKPVALSVRAFSNHIKHLNVIDLFGGSGSTLLGAEQTGRKSHLMELDPKYCDVIVQRYINFCNENNRPFIVKKNGEEYTGRMLDDAE